MSPFHNINYSFDKPLSQTLQVNDNQPDRTATPEDLIRATKGVTLATAKAVAAGNSGKQEDVVQAANVGRRYCTELLIVCKVSLGMLLDVRLFLWLINSWASSHKLYSLQR